MKKTILFLFPLVLMFTACKYIDNGSVQYVQLELSLNATTFHVDEHIIAHITLTNVGKKPLLINGYLTLGLPHTPSPIRGMAFMITKPSGESYVPDIMLNPIPPRLEDFITIDPGQSIEREYDLAWYSYTFSESGEYQIIANYQNSINPSAIDPQDTRTAWKGECNSNKITFFIK